MEGDDADRLRASLHHAARYDVPSGVAGVAWPGTGRAVCPRARFDCPLLALMALLSAGGTVAGSHPATQGPNFPACDMILTLKQDLFGASG